MRRARWSGRLNASFVRRRSLHAFLSCAFLSALLLTLTLSFAQAQQRLVVNGVPVAGLSTELVPGTSYAPAEPYARALGADYRFDAQAGVLLSFGGRLVTLESFDTPAQAAAASAALVADGRVLPGPGAVRAQGVVYLPVKNVASALGGHTAYLAEAQTVAVVFSRPRLLAAEPPRVWGSFERFVLSFSAPVGLEPYFEASLNVVRFRFPRAELGSEALAGRRFSGSRFSDAAFVPNPGSLDFNLTLQAGSRFSVFSEPVGDGERVVIDVFRAARDQLSGEETPALVLAAGAGTTPFAGRLRRALEVRGVEGLFISEAGEAQAQLRFTAPLLLSLRQAPLAAGRFSVTYLAGAEMPTLSAPVRHASADTALSAAGRARLASLTPDLGRGERLARGLADALERRTPLTLASLMGAPLLELSGAAGRGVMLELSPADLADATLAAPLAAVVADLLRDR